MSDMSEAAVSEAQTILWRRFDVPGHESARVFSRDSLWHLVGTAVFNHARNACRLDYEIVCNSGWQTLSARVSGWVGAETIAVDIAADAARRWRLDDAEIAEVAGCIDVDLNFSPSTNLLPIRRLNLAIGEEAAVSAAWLRFPSFKLERLEQSYRRISEATYRYQSAGGSFVRELGVNPAGFVTRYTGLWEEETTV